MIREEVEKRYRELQDIGKNNRDVLNTHDDSTFICLDDYDGAIKGITDECNVVYSYRDMIECMMIQFMFNNPNMNEDDAWNDANDYVSYNTLRAIPYMPSPKPIVYFDLD